MRPKNLVKAFLLTILVSGLLVNLANIKSFAQGNQNINIGQVIQLANTLENKYEEVNTALRYQVNGVAEIERQSIIDLVITQNNLVTQWKKFESNFCQKDTKNCTDKNEDFAQRINENLQSLGNIKPLFENQQQTILSTDQYKSYIAYLSKLKANKEAAKNLSQLQKDSPENPIASNVLVSSIQEIIIEELAQAETNDNLAQIEQRRQAIESESGLFFRQTQKWVKQFSTQKSRSIENDLLQINNKLLALDSRVSSPSVNSTILYIIFGWLMLLTIGVLISLYFKFFRRKHEKSADTPQYNLNEYEIKNRFSTLYEKSIKDGKESQKLFLQGLRELQSNSIEVCKEVTINNNKTSENIAKLLAKNNQESTQLLILIRELLDVIRKNNTYQKNTIKTQYDNQSGNTEAIKKTTSDRMPSILFTLRNSDQLENLVVNYNNNQVNNIVKVSATDESIEKIRSGIKTLLILMQDNNGSYWVVLKPQLPDNCYFLVPKSGLIINDRIHQTVEDIFLCKGYQKRSSNNFKLVLPAVVKSRSNNEWELVESGELLFEENQML